MVTSRLFGRKATFRKAARNHINGGIVLVIMALLALAIANSPLGDEYFAFWQQPLYVQVGSFNLLTHNGQPLTLHQFISDGLMVVFFFSVGLEIKREVLVGELSSPRKALLPVVAACGGMICPILIYFLFTHGTPESRGMAIPMATDIAFSLGALSLCGKGVPVSLKVFLTAFAVVDDIGGILVIAVFYATNLHLSYLLLAAVVVAIMLAGNRLGVRRHVFYWLMTLVLWYLFMQSGVHSTIAGVIAAFTIPALPDEHVGRYINGIRRNLSAFPDKQSRSAVLTREQIDHLRVIEEAGDRVISPLQSMENKLSGAVNYFIMPLFALANAGVQIVGSDGQVDAGLVTLAVMVGLVVGKFVGIFSFTLLAVKSGLSPMPRSMNTANLAAVSLLGGIGFTVSLFIADLSFHAHAALLNQAKFGVLAGTLVAAILGVSAMKLYVYRHSHRQK